MLFFMFATDASAKKVHESIATAEASAVFLRRQPRKPDASAKKML
jgi:hypothetical protein